MDIHSGAGIPPSIMQTSKNRLPDWVIRRTLTIAGQHFSYAHFTDAEIYDFFSRNPLPDFPHVAQRFASLRSGEHKADLFRYYYLYVKGGVYFDTDVLLVSDLEPILSGRDFVSVTSAHVPGSLFQGFLCTTARHPVLHRAVADVCETSNDALKADHHLLCKNLRKFVEEFGSSASPRPHGTLLLTEHQHRRKVARVVNGQGQTILYHYWRRDYPPSIPILDRQAPWFVHWVRTP